MIVDRHKPARIWQWGSLLHRADFCEWSDIDIALEGLRGPEALFQVYADAEQLTRFPFDIVELDRLAPEFADLIRAKGIVVYDRDQPDPGPRFRA